MAYLDTILEKTKRHLETKAFENCFVFVRCDCDIVVCCFSFFFFFFKFLLKAFLSGSSKTREPSLATSLGHSIGEHHGN